LQGRELLVCNGLGVLVTRDVDVYDAARVDVGREEDGREFDLEVDHGQHVRLQRYGLRRSCLYTMILSGRYGRMGVGAKRMLFTHKAFVFGKEHSDSSVDFADSQ
jgi:hypothetical protein